MAERPAPISPGQPGEPDQHLVERRVGDSRLVHQGGFLEVRRDQILLPDGSQAWREYIVHPGAVAIVPLLDDGRIVLERQYRYPLQQVLLEIPAGKIDPGESAAACACRELREETGYQARQWALAGRMHSAPAYSTEFIEIWFARGLVAGPARLDEGEFIELQLVAQTDLDRLAADGLLTDAKTLIALLWLRRWQAGDWPLQWRDAATMAP